ncbi:MAG: SiaB family protein kinase [Chitinophagales bacterium]|nr:SiaB family protein kinase [Chitinophagales bacterium]
MISQDLLSLIGLSLRRRNDNEMIAKRLFGLVIELAQNIYHYSTEKSYSEKDKKEVGVGIIAIGETNEHYIVCSGNRMDSRKIKPITERCDYINQLDDDGLKLYYKEQRRNPSVEDSKGAGLGLIDMVRKSGNPLTYVINDSDKQNAFLTLCVRINKTLGTI